MLTSLHISFETSRKTRLSKDISEGPPKCHERFTCSELESESPGFVTHLAKQRSPAFYDIRLAWFKEKTLWSVH